MSVYLVVGEMIAVFILCEDSAEHVIEIDTHYDIISAVSKVRLHLSNNKLTINRSLRRL